jgi:hypothetical protein
VLIILNAIGISKQIESRFFSKATVSGKAREASYLVTERSW